MLLLIGRGVGARMPGGRAAQQARKRTCEQGIGIERQEHEKTQYCVINHKFSGNKCHEDVEYYVMREKNIFHENIFPHALGPRASDVAVRPLRSGLVSRPVIGAVSAV